MGNWKVRGSVVLLASLAAVGCATHTGTGALAGGGLGALTGALIGSAGGDAASGAAIGAGIGAATGGLLGASQDEQEKRNAELLAAASAPGPMTAADVVSMTRGGVSDSTIVASIRSTNSVFRLTAADVTELHQLGVSDPVIRVMLDSARRPVPVRGGRAVGYEPAPIYLVEPAPPVSIGFGYHFHRR